MNTKNTRLTYVALLRSINVGGNNKIEMKKLKKTFEDLNFTRVQTVIASGNVIFETSITDTKKLISQIELAIKTDFGIRVKVLVRSEIEIKKLLNAIGTDWVNNTRMKCDVMFLWEEIDTKDILQQLHYNPDIEEVRYIKGQVIWRIDRENASKSRMLKIIGTKFYQDMTIRNPNTVRKIYAVMKGI